MNGRSARRQSIFSTCVDLGILDSAEQEFPEREQPFCTGLSVVTDHYEHPLDRRDRERSAALQSEWHAWLRRRLVSILGCEKTVRVLLAIYDGRIKRAEVARCLNVPRCKVTREIDRLKRIIADRW